MTDTDSKLTGRILVQCDASPCQPLSTHPIRSVGHKNGDEGRMCETDTQTDGWGETGSRKRDQIWQIVGMGFRKRRKCTGCVEKHGGVGDGELRDRDLALVSGCLWGTLLTLSIVHSSTPNHSQQGGCVCACVCVSVHWPCVDSYISLALFSHLWFHTLAPTVKPLFKLLWSPLMDNSSGWERLFLTHNLLV